MSFNEQLFSAVPILLEEGNIPDADCSDLLQVIEPLDDEINILAEAIAVCLEHHRTAIADTIDSQLANTSTSEDRLPGKGKTPDRKSIERLNKQILLNAIQRSKPNK